jgi:hypothetical protein
MADGYCRFIIAKPKRILLWENDNNENYKSICRLRDY